MHAPTQLNSRMGCLNYLRLETISSPEGVIFFPINAPGMGRFQLNLGGFGLWVRVKILGSDCNNRFPNTNHNLSHNSLR